MQIRTILGRILHVLWSYGISFEALDRNLWVFWVKTQPMRGALVLLPWDFRQTLPVIPRSTPAYMSIPEIISFIESSLKNHSLNEPAWSFSEIILCINICKTTFEHWKWQHIEIVRTKIAISLPPIFSIMQPFIIAVLDHVYSQICQTSEIGIGCVNVIPPPIKYSSKATVMDEE